MQQNLNNALAALRPKSFLRRAFRWSRKIPDISEISFIVQNELLQAATLAACLVATCNQESDATPAQIRILKNAEGWRALATVLRLPYFRRKWIIQEIFASQNVVVLSEDHTCDLKIFTDCLSLMTSRGPLKRVPDL